uniref:Aminopeptidase n=3 Tax=Plutella xylostella TaxID=51655 RepID=A0A6G5NKQ5_PLUXY|nr:aminopeptidase N4a [Plutella xylostella]
MGSSILLPVLALVFLVGAIHSSPYDEFRSSIVEFYDTNLDEPKYRLKDNVKPLRQTVDLDVYLDEDRFDGETSIYILTADNDMKQIVLHQNVVSISSVSVFNVTGAPVPLQTPGAFETDPYYEILMINLANPIPVGEYTLKIVYKGRINTNPLDRGFYKGYYFTDSSNTKMEYYATTQFQPYHARKAFPCFDEPQFKSYFTISITRPEDFSQSYSNMAIEKFETIVKEDGSTRVRETFYRTPIVSAYLLAFHVSKFVETQVNVDNKPFGVISRPGPVDQHAYAIRLGQLTTNWLSTKLKFDYYAMGEGVAMKNDHIALPDFPSGAMENWGMVNYREAYLLYDEQNTNLQNQIFIATIISHEMAHKWFGNLVTCFWWSNLWLNESFASFFEYFSTHGADPSLELDDQFVVDHVHSALAADASSGATPMNWTGVVTNPSINAHFSTTSYAKGASVLRMMEHFVGSTTFYKALEYYLRENQYQLGDPKKMYAAFETAVAEDGSLSQYTNVKITDVFDSWIQNPGAPVVHVNVDHSTGVITVKQERYQLSGIRPNTLWQIPLTYTRGDDVDFSNTKPSTVLVGESTTINKPAGHEWVIFNVAQSGYYRVNYDDHSWEMIAGGLRTSREAVHKLNRAQIVNDVLYFLRSGDVSIERAFDVLAFLKEETDYYVWAGAIGQLTWLRRRTEHIPALYNEFSAYLLEQMDAVINQLGYNENPSDSTSTILNRVQILNFACTLGHEGCVTDSLAKWKAFRETPTNLVHKNLRRHVYCVGVREGDRTDYDFLWQRYNSSQNTADMVVMLRALGCTKDEATLQHYLQQSLYSSSIRIHDKTNVVSYALLGNQENVKGVLNFIYNNYESIRTQYGGSARLETVLSTLAAYLTDFSDIVAFQSWLYSNQLKLEGTEFRTGVNVINSAISNLDWASKNAIGLNAFLIGRNAAASVIAPITLLIAAVAMHLLR